MHIPKTNVDTQNDGLERGGVMTNVSCRGVDGLERVTPLQGWQLLVSILDFWGERVCL